MCGRFVLSNFTDVKDFHNVLIEPSYNIAPSHHTLIINKEMRPDFLEWGYSPIWAKKPMNLINAKYESLDIKPSFKDYELAYLSRMAGLNGKITLRVKSIQYSFMLIMKFFILLVLKTLLEQL